jgi:hypothetical protein
VVGGSAVTVAASIDATGNESDSVGGEDNISAKGALTVSSPITVRGGVGASNAYSEGGSMSLTAGCSGMSVNAVLDARGGIGSGFDGGAVSLRSPGAINLQANTDILTSATAGSGSGGDVLIDSDGTVTLASGAVIDARGDTANTDGDGAGAIVEISGCRIDILGTAAIHANGYEGGAIRTFARGVSTAQSQTQPLEVSGTSDLNVAGSAAARNGEMLLKVRNRREGTCSNDANLKCQLNTDCTVGCQTGTCNYANPDTAGVSTQFDVTPVIEESAELLACPQTCP